MTAAPNLGQRGLYFILIGTLAAGVHVSLVLIMVRFCHMHPLIANGFAFLMAFNISYLGHKHLTFSALTNEKKLSLPHFFVVASTAGIMNEALYYMLLQYTSMNYLAALILVLVMVAAYNFIVSRFWACR